MNAFWPLVGRVLGALVLPFLLVTTALAQDVTADVSALLRLKDDADPAIITRIAATGTREGAQGLIEAYDRCSTILVRRLIVRALGRFDGSGEAEQPALGKVASIAAAAEEPELRDAAIQTLADCRNLGKHFLRQLVDSKASDLVREPAMAAHVRRAEAADLDWYRHVWNLTQEQRKDDDGKIAPPELPTIRLLAFEGAVKFLGEPELVETLRREREPKIRRRALVELNERGLPKAAEMAEWMLERVDFPGADRRLAARIYADRVGAKALPTFLGLAKKREVTPEDLRCEMAELLAGMRDDGVQKKVQKLIGKGKPHERVFALLAGRDVVEAKKLQKELANKELEVRRAAARVIGERRLKELEPELRKMLEKGRQPEDKRLAIATLGAILKGSDPWLEELAEFARDPDRDVRNAAVEQIGHGKWRPQIEVLAAALDHADWSTRCCAVDALLEMKDKKVVPLLIARMPQDPGRLSKRIAEVLWELTAQPFGEDHVAWSTWWKEAGEKFEIASAAQLAKAEEERKRKRLTERTRTPAKFFGLEIVSRRVLFVIDVSGSMIEAMYGRTYEGRPAARIDVVRQEAIAAIERLDSGALFNVYAFSNGVEKWQDRSAGTNDAASRKSAITWVERLGASGGTNIYDALQLAFEDPDVDTIYLLSDGQPTAGEETDPHRIREDVAFWNRHRKVQIHTIAVGDSLELLEWLAEDSGGQHIKMR